MCFELAYFSNPKMPRGSSALIPLVQQAMQLRYSLPVFVKSLLNSSVEKFPTAVTIVPKNKVQCRY